MDTAFMKLAIEEAKKAQSGKDVPVGAVVVTSVSPPPGSSMRITTIKRTTTRTGISSLQT